MTGYGISQATAITKRGKLEFSVEVRTVNSKFLDLNLRSPRPYVVFDSAISEKIRERFKRGRIDFTLNARVLEGPEREIIVNLAQAQAVKVALEEVQQKLQLSDPVQLANLLEFPEWIQSRDASINQAEEWPHLEKTIQEALEQCTKTRRAEGAKLHSFIQTQRKDFGVGYEKVRLQEDHLLRDLRTRAKERVLALFDSQGFDPHRLEQEIALWTARSDVKEELDRLQHHLQTFDQMMGLDQEVGRRLEFILQEIHREVNTLGTKCPDPKLTPVIIEMKTCLERIREQIQNVE